MPTVTAVLPRAGRFPMFIRLSVIMVGWRLMGCTPIRVLTMSLFSCHCGNGRFLVMMGVRFFDQNEYLS